MRWQSSGQFCISPSMVFPLVLVLSRCTALQMTIRKPCRPGCIYGGGLRRNLRKVTRVRGACNPRIMGSACPCGSAKSPQREPADIMACRPGGGEVGQHLADHRRELEPVSRTWRGENDAAGTGQLVDEKVTVGGHGVETGRCSDEFPICHWQMLRNGAA